MFENITEEMLLQRMLDRVDDKYDKREGSIIQDAIAPTALEHKNMYISLDEVLNESFIDTMSLPYLKRKGDEMGVKYKYASQAVVKLQTNVDIRVGSQFTCNDLTFTTTKKLSNFVYSATCDAAGSDANLCMGDVIMTENHTGLTEAKIIEVSIEGEDDEETETYRNRLLTNVNAEEFGGNKADYKAKVGSINGVGGVKVYSGREWNGGGTVKVVFTTSSFNVPSQTLIDQVQNEIDPEANAGEGMGTAPIGHVVTCVGANGTTVNITADFTFLDESYHLNACITNMQTAIDEHFLKLNQSWEDLQKITVRVADIISVLMDVEGVLDVQNVALNGSTNNLIVDKDSLVVRGTINEL